MSTTSSKKTPRDIKHLTADISAVHAIAQAAVNVELFTIPLYMVSMYSIQGTHQITSNNNLYEGRLWPGIKTQPKAKSSNAKAFNKIFKVFIEEMLHLQLASNIATVIGIAPTFTSPMLQDSRNGWTCYGPGKTAIPHILDFKDTIAPYSEIKVKLDSMNKEQVKLFLAVEETEDNARAIIKPEALGKYFPEVPFKGWSANNTEVDLPMFGSIGHMYLCMWDYFEIEYNDGTTLWERLFALGVIGLPQQDLFNQKPKLPEYPGISSVFTTKDPVKGKQEVLNMISGITDQGEGKEVSAMLRARQAGLTAVQPEYQACPRALKQRNPGYDDKGNPIPISGDAYARTHNNSLDHFEVFEAVQKLIEEDDYMTWDQWHENPENKWTAAMLQTGDSCKTPYNLPSTESIASALNNLKDKDSHGSNYKLLSQAAAGAIAGITTVLDEYWKDRSGKKKFPFPSMVGSGDRVSICWAIMGKFPNLALGVEPRNGAILNHACQGMDYNQKTRTESCAEVPIYHTCRGSNSCAAEGGCGFVQEIGGSASCGANCGSKSLARVPSKDPATLYNAPNDNSCGGQGGCAVPISASQLFPHGGKMQLYDFNATGGDPTKFDTLEFDKGEKVHDIAWKAYLEVLKKKGVSPLPTKPADSDLRLAFPPST